MVELVTTRAKSPTVSRYLSVTTDFCIETGASKASKMSYSDRKAEGLKAAKDKKEWDASTTMSQKGLDEEDKIAAKIAAEVLKDNAKLRAVHSGQSIKMLLEREAKRQLQLQAAGGEYKGPVIARIQERQAKADMHPSNLPYLNKNPAI